MDSPLHKHYSRKLRFIVSVFLAFLLSFSPILPSLKPLILFGWLISKASVSTWDGGGEDNNWSNPANWAGDQLPEAQDIATFDATSSKDVVIDQAISVAGLEILEGFAGKIEHGQANIEIGSQGMHQYSGSFIGGTAPIFIHGDITLVGGSFSSTSGTLELKGSFSNISDVFRHNTGTVVLSGVAQTLLGSTNFYTLRKITADADLLEINASAITAHEALTLKGAAKNMLRLRSAEGGRTVKIIAEKAVDAEYLDIMDMATSAGGEIICRNCVDSGHTNGWQVITQNILPETNDNEPGVAPQPSLSPAASPIGSLLPPSSIVPTPSPSASPSELVSESVTGSSSPDFTVHEPIEFELKFDKVEETIIVEGVHEDIPAINREIEQAAPMPPLPSPVPTLASPAPTIEASPLPQPSPSPASDSLVSYLTKPIRQAGKRVQGFFGIAHAAEPLAQVSENTIGTTVKDKNNNVVQIPIDVKEQSDKTIVSITGPESALAPGKYTLEISTQIDGKTFSASQIFTWGVVAMNFNKSSYVPQEPAHIGISTLDDEGATICDAALTLTITAPDATTTNLQTQDGSIITGNNCAQSNVTDEPDYHTVFTPTLMGEHSVSLTAVTANGTRQLNDKFLVTQDAAFIVERAGATRIFPPSPYTMRLTLLSKEDITTRISESVPASFVLTDISNNGTAEASGDRQIITWDVTLRANQPLELKYTYDAPDVSPELYLLGPVEIHDGGPSTRSAPSGLLWQDPRSWQLAADVIADGANAVDALGQYDNSLSAPQPIYTKGLAHNAPNRLGYDQVIEAFVDSTDNRLFVSDFLNHRVLVYNLNANDTLIDRIPDNVLGQTNFYTNTAATTQAGMNRPRGLAYDSTNKRLFVVNVNANRVITYDVTAITDGENAVNVLGQVNFTSGAAATTQSRMNTPQGVTFDSTNNRLFVSETSGNRVTVYDVAAISDGENAVNVLGQTNFTNTGAATTQTGMNLPRRMAFDSTNNRLFVAESVSDRVTVFDVAAISDGENAVNVLGQTNFTNAGAATTQAGMNAPDATAFDSTNNRLFVVNTHRVTVYDVAAITDGENAVNVLGQANFTSSTAATTQAGLNTAGGSHVAFDSTNNMLYVSQAGNHRISVFDVAAISDGESAVDGLGQFDDNLTTPSPIYTKGTEHDAPNRLGLDTPGGSIVDSVGDRLFVADDGNNRVLVYNLNTNDTLIDRIPDNVLGQANFYTNASATSQTGLGGPQDVAYDTTNKRLFVADLTGDRIVVYDVTAISDGENAVNVLGQSTFTGAAAATTQAGLNVPRAVDFDSTNNRLFVAESGSNRVVVYNVAAISNGEDAVNVLGQANFTTATAATTQAGMNVTRGVAFDSANNRLFVSEGSSNRVTVFDVTAITDGEDAVNVLGQANFTTATAATTQAGMNSPREVVYDAGSIRLFVAQATGNRVTVYDVAAISDGENAVNVLGQTNFTNTAAATTQARLNVPSGLAYDSVNRRLLVGEGSNERVMIFDVGTTTPTTDQLMRHGLYWQDGVEQRFFWAN